MAAKAKGGGGTSTFGRPEGTGPDGEITERAIERFADEMADELFADLRRHERDVIPDRCAQCGGTDLIPIEYGIPIAAMMRAAAAGKIVLGGPNRKPGAPTVKCRGCRRRSGSVSEFEPEDLEPPRNPQKVEQCSKR
jgi:hypothetical protein